MAEVAELETHDLPGIGEFRARKGTSTSELAGAVAYWAKRANKAEKQLMARRIDAVVAGAFGGAALLGLVLAALQHWL